MNLDVLAYGIEGLNRGLCHGLDGYDGLDYDLELHNHIDHDLAELLDHGLSLLDYNLDDLNHDLLGSDYDLDSLDHDLEGP